MKITFDILLSIAKLSEILISGSIANGFPLESFEFVSEGLLALFSTSPLVLSAKYTQKTTITATTTVITTFNLLFMSSISSFKFAIFYSFILSLIRYSKHKKKFHYF